MTISRFIQAQSDPDAGYAAALMEIRTTGKRGHWVWYIFPQLAGLGPSSDAQYYGIADAAEAAAYLDHPVLGARLVEIGDAVAERVRGGTQLTELMNSEIDVLKLVSCMTLVKGVAERVPEAERTGTHRRLIRVATEVLAAAEAKRFWPCALTTACLSDK